MDLGQLRSVVSASYQGSQTRGNTMAVKRSAKKTAEPVVSNTEVLVRLFVILEAFESTEDNPTSTDDLMAEYKTLHNTNIPSTTMFAWLT
jgi:hypothetical protein